MFRDDAQICEAIRCLLAPLGLEDLWTATGPTERACEYLEHGSPLSSGEHFMVQVAFDFWNGDGGAPLAKLANGIDRPRVEAIFTLILASHAGAVAVDDWISEARDLHPPRARHPLVAP